MGKAAWMRAWLIALLGGKGKLENVAPVLSWRRTSDLNRFSHLLATSK